MRVSPKNVPIQTYNYLSLSKRPPISISGLIADQIQALLIGCELGFPVEASPRRMARNSLRPMLVKMDLLQKLSQARMGLGFPANGGTLNFAAGIHHNE
jgi:hypothetical protein